MNAIMKLAATALGATGIIAGAALAQTAMNPADPTNPATANYSISPNSNLKRDGSLSGPDAVPAIKSDATTDMSTTTSSVVSTTTPANEAPVAAAPMAETPVADATPAPRADRN